MVVIDLDRFVLMAVAVVALWKLLMVVVKDLNYQVPSLDFEDMMDNFEILYVVVDYYKIH